MRKSFVPKASEVTKDWYIVDAKDIILGRLCTKVATILRGKHKPMYTPHLDLGDYVIVINSDKVKFTGKKLDQKVYFHHTGWIGGDKYITLRNQMEKRSEKVIEDAIRGMLPKGPLGRKMFKKLFVYSGEEHPHQAQQPKLLKV
ncbi:MAG: 50S ribosomal protein L13 [Eubacteriales bacterium]|nr:50S ribosomal protein L13 [Eubacteriales bacterium]